MGEDSARHALEGFARGRAKETSLWPVSISEGMAAVPGPWTLASQACLNAPDEDKSSVRVDLGEIAKETRPITVGLELLLDPGWMRRQHQSESS